VSEPLPLLASVGEIHRRLQEIFPEGTPQRSYCTREIAARTVFVMMYVGAIDGKDTWIGPKHVYRMGDAQAALQSDESRTAYAASVEKPGYRAPPDRWFQDNTREPIRDETLKDGLVRVGAVIVRSGLPTTSSKPRYALQSAIAELFDPQLNDAPLKTAIEAWQEKYLSPEALARVQLQRRSAFGAKSKVLVTLPNGESRQMEAGPSSIITKAVIEVFASRFLGEAAVLWVSESGKKIIQRDDELMRSLNIEIESDKLLPDTILVDLSAPEPLFIFVEAVASDGPITEARRAALLELISQGNIKSENCAFVTAFQDRDDPAFKKAVPNLAWGSFAWCSSEPEHLIVFDGSSSGGIRRLADLFKPR